MKNLYTIIMSFSDHLKGIGQYEAESPLEALREFIKFNESLDQQDRDLLLKSILGLIHYKNVKGIWGFAFDPDQDFSGKDDNPVLGGSIIQTDPNGAVRE